MADTTIIKSQYNIYNPSTSEWEQYSFDTQSESVEFTDGNDAETKLGAINGITSSLSSTATDIAASASTVYELNRDLHTLNYKDLGSGGTVAMTLSQSISHVCFHHIAMDSCGRGRFLCADGWFDYDIIRSADDYCSGFVSGHTKSEAYQFYRERGADPVIKKLGSPEIRTKTVTNASGSFDAGGKVLFAGFVKTTWHISTYEHKYGHSSYPLATVTYSGSTITYSMAIDKSKENDVSGMDSYSATIIYAIE